MHNVDLQIFYENKEKESEKKKQTIVRERSVVLPVANTPMTIVSTMKED